MHGKNAGNAKIFRIASTFPTLSFECRVYWRAFSFCMTNKAMSWSNGLRRSEASEPANNADQPLWLSAYVTMNKETDSWENTLLSHLKKLRIGSQSANSSRHTHIARIVAMRKARWHFLPLTPTSWFI